MPKNPQNYGCVSRNVSSRFDKWVTNLANAATPPLSRLGSPPHEDEHDPGSVLSLGLGLGAVPTLLRRRFPRATIDVVELDESVVDTAVWYFCFDPDVRVVVDDALAAVGRAAQRGQLPGSLAPRSTGGGAVAVGALLSAYDVIIVDVYHSGTPVGGAAFFADVAALLAPGGRAAVNREAADIEQWAASFKAHAPAGTTLLFCRTKGCRERLGPNRAGK